MVKVGFAGRLLVAAAAGALLAGSVLAQDRSGPNAAAAKGAETPASLSNQEAVLAFQLADWGRRNQDADALVQAAAMLKTSVPAMQATTRGTLQTRDGKPVTATGSATGEVDTADTLLAEARTLARGNPQTLARIQQVSATASKAPVGGQPIREVRDIPPESVWTLEFNARGGEVLRLGAKGDGSADIDMVVFDENGREVCRDVLTDSVPVCVITPAWTGKFQVRVFNPTGRWTRTLFIAA